ncbi:unnamed protein product [Anisakis simplex]|uniref:Putative ammonium transporter 2 (inferred by orthology to a C. elegans protein) n=1 Tax=Anisakis simplex TaxID=6269 RepID=A0A0M3KCI9_ANISI|nr:unnamed protein product [Anisakis simplex]
MKSAVATILSSVGGGCTSIVISMIATKKCQVNFLIDGLLASLVSTTALATYPLMERLEIDDPVGVVPVHVVAPMWGMLCVGIFAKHDPNQIDLTRGFNGILYGGGFYLLGVQALAVVATTVWSTLTCLTCLFILSRSPLGVRMTKYEEQIGADLIEHGLSGHNIARYAIEKKLTTKSFTSVMKAIIRWKKLTREARAIRQLRSVLPEAQTTTVRTSIAPTPLPEANHTNSNNVQASDMTGVLTIPRLDNGCMLVQRNLKHSRRTLSFHSDGADPLSQRSSCRSTRSMQQDPLAVPTPRQFSSFKTLIPEPSADSHNTRTERHTSKSPSIGIPIS